MPLSPKTAKFLLSLGYDAIHLFEVSQITATDSEIIEMGKKQNRIILTMDLDFGTILAHTGASIPGVIIFRIRYATVDRVNFYLKKLLGTFTEGKIKNSVIVIEETRIRHRPLPIKSE